MSHLQDERLREQIEENGAKIQAIEASLQQLNEMMRNFMALQNTNLRNNSPPQIPIHIPDPLPTQEPADGHSHAQPMYFHIDEIRDNTAVDPATAQPTVRDEIEILKAEVRKMKSPGLVNGIPVRELCYYPGGQLPHNFRLPEFNKYDGKSCPHTHLKIYCNDMFEVCENERLMIQMFHKSLTGDALHWYSNQDMSRVKSWEEFTQIFLQHFRFNLELLPKKADLEMMTQSSRESILEYAYRWRQTASRLQNVPPENELIPLFLKTLGPTYQNILIAQIFPDFATLIMSASQIERGIKEGIVPDQGSSSASSSNNRAFQKKPNGDRKNEVSMISSRQPHLQYQTNTVAPPGPQYRQPAPAPVQYQQHMPQSHYQTPPQYQPQANYPPQPQYPRRPPAPRRVFTPIPYPASQILNHLLEQKKITLPAPRPLPNPLPANFKHEEFCAFHRVPGHTTDACFNLKHLIQDMIENGQIVFGQPAAPVQQMGIQQNPLPNHDPSSSKQVNMIGDNSTPSEPQIAPWGSPFSTPSIYTVGTSKPSPLILPHCEPLVLPNLNAQFSSLHLNPPASSFSPVQFPMATPLFLPLAPLNPQDMTRVPWAYDSNSSKENQKAKAEIDSITRSGRIYQPDEIQNKGKGKEAEVPAEKSREEKEKEEKEKHAEIEAFEKAIRKSKYHITEHLSKTPAQISILGLLLSSDEHREKLMEILQKAYVRADIEPESLANAVGVIMAPRVVSFSEDELTSEGDTHNKPLMISVTVDDFCVSNVLIDNGSGLNICPLKTMKVLGISEEGLKKNPMAIRAFDNSTRQSLGDIEINIIVANTAFKMDFQVLDIKASFTLLLGRPWIHSANAIPSSLHQRVKFFVNNELITVMADDEVKLKKHVVDVQHAEPTDTYVSFQFETISSIEEVRRKKEKAEKLPPHLHIMALMKFDPDKGLGARGQGKKKTLKTARNIARFGLGYKPEWEDTLGRKGRIKEETLFKNPLMLVYHFYKNFIRYPFPQTSIISSSAMPMIPEEAEPTIWFDEDFEEQQYLEACVVSGLPYIEPENAIRRIKGPLQNWTSVQSIVQSEEEVMCISQV